METTAEAPIAMTPAAPKQAGFVRWIICFLLFLAVVLSYVDRQVISLLKPDLTRMYHWSETGSAGISIWFQAFYGIAYLFAGRIIDRVGAKAGYTAAMILWTIGHMLQATVTSTTGMIFARIPLAMGEAATYPAALVAANSWFPKSDRAFAIGMLNAGANIGIIVAAMIVPAVAFMFGWQMAFIATGLLSFVWLPLWWIFYRKPRDHKMVSAAELAWIEAEPVAAIKSQASYAWILSQPQTWAYMCGRFLIDPVWWTFLFWLPSFFAKQFAVKLTGFGPPLIAIYLMADLGSIFGGYASSRFIRGGWPINKARKTAMLIMACIVLPVAFTTFVPNMWMAVALIGLACAGHQGFSTNLFTIPGDLYPHHASGTVAGLGGFAGACGGMLMALFSGMILQTTGGDYTPIFMVSSVAYFTAFAVVHLLCPRWEKVSPEPANEEPVAS